MLLTIIVFSISISLVKSGKDDSTDDLGQDLITSLREDANLDLPPDEEYEDLRAELLAYNTALASLTRRSLQSTPCWTLGGVCIHHKLCNGERYMSEIAGCKNRLNVCCFAWNKYKVKDMRDKGIGAPVYPWSFQTGYGGKGIVPAESEDDKLKSKKKNKNKSRNSNKKKELSNIMEPASERALALIITK